MIYNPDQQNENNMEKSIRDQIKEQPKLHYNLFACWATAIICFCVGETDGCFTFLATSAIISAIIDVKAKR